MEVSLAYGGGDVHWFESLSREDQVAVLGYRRYASAARERGAAHGRGRASNSMSKHVRVAAGAGAFWGLS